MNSQTSGGIFVDSDPKIFLSTISKKKHSDPISRREAREIDPLRPLYRLDTGATGTAGRGHPTMETVGAVHRPTNKRRKGQGQP